ncbi:hypothetical protein J2X66_004184 [Pseudomonas sp. 3296]|nr:hypothetical protein [Pseudomonas sp. 3296]
MKINLRVTMLAVLTAAPLPVLAGGLMLYEVGTGLWYRRQSLLCETRQ